MFMNTFTLMLVNKRNLYIVTEPLGPSLYEAIIQKKKKLKLNHLQKLIIDLLVALKFLKSRGIIHCDIKPENILFLNEHSKNVKLIDFGSATFIDDIDYSYLQTRPYRSPEIVFGCKFDFSVDIWSLGCVLYELVAFKLLFKYKTVEENVAKAMAINQIYNTNLFSKGSTWKKFVIKGRYLNNCNKLNRSGEVDVVFPNKDYDFKMELMSLGCHDLLVDFITKCLILNPVERMTVEEALEHPFLSLTE